MIRKVVFTMGVQMKLLESKQCYADIPVEGQEGKAALWVDPITRLVKQHSAPQSCSIHFPTLIQEKGLWLELPTLKTVQPPAITTLLQTQQSQVLNVARGGLYTDSKIRSWEDLLNFPTYQEALFSSLSLGSCIGAGICPQVDHQVPYDLNRLIQLEQQVMNPLSILKKFAAEYGGICAILVLIYTIGKLVINMTLITLILIREGGQATLAFLVQSLASPFVKYKQVRRRHRKIQLRNLRENNPEGNAEPEE